MSLSLEPHHENKGSSPETAKKKKDHAYPFIGIEFPTTTVWETRLTPHSTNSTHLVIVDVKVVKIDQLADFFGDLADSRISGAENVKSGHSNVSFPCLRCAKVTISQRIFYFCSPGEIVIVNEQICRHHNIAVVYIVFPARRLRMCVCAHSRFIIRGDEGTKSRVGKGDVHRQVRYSQIILAHEHDSL